MSITADTNTTSSRERVRTPDSNFENFSVGRKIGSGSFSVVKLATHIPTSQIVAFKILFQEKIDQLEMSDERIWREIDNLRQCASHPHILHFYDVKHASPMGKDLTIITEYVYGGTLYKLIHEQKSRLLAVNEARFFFQQIVSGLEYMHHHRIAHRDLTLDNILVDGDQTFIKIADLGFSRRVPDKGGGKMSTACGSPNYASPELLNGIPYDGLAVDIWSLGVVLYIMLSGSMPFNEENEENLFNKIRGGIYNFPKTIGRDAKKLIATMFTVEATTRVTISGVRKSTFYRKRLPRCLKHSREVVSANMQYQSDTPPIDPLVINQLLECYDKSDIPQANDGSSENNESSHNIPVTRNIVEQALSNKNCPNKESQSETTQDVQLAYKLMLHKKLDTKYCKLLAKQPKISFWCHFITLCALCVFLSKTKLYYRSSLYTVFNEVISD